MPLTPEPDLSYGEWFAQAQPRSELSSRGPAVFASYAQLVHPVHEGDDPQDPAALLCVEGDLADRELEVLVDVLGQHTTTPGDCFFGLWDGFGDIHGSPSVTLISLDGEGPLPPAPPAFTAEVIRSPRLCLPGRDYLLFRGSLSEAGQWGAADLMPGWPRRINSPNLMWPADHAWFVATEIDHPWTGIGGSEALVDDLLDANDLHATRVWR
ncbi:hypothetical protein GCM10009867_33060 [Pedococcus aerophilus]|uniref:Uncharacterized protein n=1 Tax=Pedococcus aerophilus TaxID=436356 RepID=A0ABP6HAP1_9MICO